MELPFVKYPVGSMLREVQIFVPTTKFEFWHLHIRYIHY